MNRARTALHKKSNVTHLRRLSENENAESFRQFQRRVALWQPWEHASHFSKAAFVNRNRATFRAVGVETPSFQTVSIRSLF
jgi:hypothetical protein